MCEGFKKIGEYNFDSDISVNILGHIFEQSISDLEELKAQAEGQEIVLDKKKGKRKKDGIFYTPPYITRYIVEQAVGGWLNDRRKEIGFDTLPVLTDEDYDSIKVTGKRKLKHERNKNISVHIAAWEAYKTVLSNIKVLDPACGSGAFLNEVFDYLKNEGQTINNELARLTAGQIELFRWDTHILANNIYGVDLNSESVEITKLSLWLKTANKNEKLTYLENNIKVGNSLINDEAVAGKLAFDWNKEFSDIMGAGGFDVVVGNPPYVLSRDSIFEDFKNHLYSEYKLLTDKINLYVLFIEKGCKLIKKKGYIAYIVPNSLLGTDSALLIREYLLKEMSLKIVLNLLGTTFDGVNVEALIFCALNEEGENNLINFRNIYNPQELHESLLSAPQKEWKKVTNYIFDLKSEEQDTALINKMGKNPPLSTFYAVKAGLQAYEKGKGNPKQSAEDVKNHIYDFSYKFDENTYPYLEGKDVLRYSIRWSGMWLRYGEFLSQPREFEMFSSPRILVREITGIYPRILQSTFVQDVFLNNKSIINILTLNKNYDLKFLLCLLNSSAIGFYTNLH